ncbi:MAG: hypothetical protein MJY99_06075 [Fibrobacter sp.]|nr:hypothetical protein [Fibrobacter sp.]
MNVTRKHDNFFKTTFEKPAHAAELLRMAAKHNDGLAEFLEALRAFKKLGRQGALAFIKEVFVYLKKVIPTEDKEKFMDTEEAYANKGYKSIYDAELEEAREEGLAEGREERKKLAAELAAQAEEIRKLKALLAQKN